MTATATSAAVAECSTAGTDDGNPNRAVPVLPPRLRLPYVEIAALTAEDGQPPLSRQCISRALRGTSTPTLETAQRLARVGGISVDELLAYFAALQHLPQTVGAVTPRFLSNSTVSEIREEYDDGNGKSCRQLAEERGISPTTISNVTRRVPKSAYLGEGR